MVLDSIMGSGKSTYVIKMMNDAWVDDMGHTLRDPSFTPRRFLVVAPYLTEVERYGDACSNLRFKEPKPKGGSKVNHLVELVDAGENIVTTHVLFKMLTKEISEKLKKQKYMLVIDEALDCVEIYDKVSLKDKELLFATGMVTRGPNNRLVWNGETHAKYKGRFDDVKRLCEIGSLVSLDGKTWFLEFPSDFLRCFSEVLICTYLFPGSMFDSYLRKEGFSVSLVTLDGDRMVPWCPNADRHARQAYRQLIRVYVGSMNKIGDEEPMCHPFSAGWLGKMAEKDAKHIRSSTQAFFERHAKTKSKLNGWTTLKDHRGKLSGKGYARGFIPCNAKGTNEYVHKASLAYLCNMYLNPVLEQYFASNGVPVDEDLYALSSMIQWVWRSRIRNGEAIDLYIPSERMRGLLKDWLDGSVATRLHTSPPLLKAA
ncbi:MAG: hypothetical protein ACK4MV_10230 [Beijerinckiaceae bacterium]